MDFAIGDASREKLEKIREWGRDAMRPAGLEADREGRPLPVDHPYFKQCIERGDGRTRWRGPKGRERKLGKGGAPSAVLGMLMSEERA